MTPEDVAASLSREQANSVVNAIEDGFEELLQALDQRKQQLQANPDRFQMSCEEIARTLTGVQIDGFLSAIKREPDSFKKLLIRELREKAASYSIELYHHRKTPWAVLRSLTELEAVHLGGFYSKCRGVCSDPSKSELDCINCIREGFEEFWTSK